MKKKDVSYEIMIDLIANIVKKYINNDSRTTKEINNASKEGELVCMH